MESPPPLLRVFWPRQLELPEHRSEVQLLGHRHSGRALEEVVVTRAAAAAAAAAGGPSVGTLLFEAPIEHREGNGGSRSSKRDASASSGNGSSLRFLLQPTVAPSVPLPIPLPPITATAATGPEPQHALTRQQSAEQQQQPLQCQIVLYDCRMQRQLLLRPGCCASAPPGAACLAACDSPEARPDPEQDHNRQLGATLASRLAGLVLAVLLLTHWQGLGTLAARFGCQLADSAATQLTWFMTSQPAGVKLHRQLAELLSLAGLHYIATLRSLLLGRGQLVAGGATGLLAAALVAGGLQHGLLALEWLLWAAGLPLSAPYAALAAVLSWQLSSTVLMWHVMRGKRQLAPLRQRLAWLARQRWQEWRDGGLGIKLGGSSTRSSSSAASLLANAPAAAADMVSFSHSPGSGLKQLSGSMLLFMPLLLLLPTTAWFYGFALALHAGASMARAAAQLAQQLAAANPLGAALGQLLLLLRPLGNAGGIHGDGGNWISGGGAHAESASSSGSSLDGVEFSVLQVQFNGLAALPCWVHQAAVATTYLQATQRHGSPWHAAAAAAARAWHACSFSGAAPATVLRDVLCGRPLFLARPEQPG